MIICKEDIEFVDENIPCGINIVESGDTVELVRALTEWLTFYGYDMHGNVTEDAEYASEIIDRLRNDNYKDFEDEEDDGPEMPDIPDGIREMYSKW